MTKEEMQLSVKPVAEQAAYWICELADEPSAERLAAFAKWKKASPRNRREFSLARDVNACLREYLDAPDIDIDALIERAKEEERARRRRVRAVCATAGITLAVLLIANVVNERTKQTYVTTEKQRLVPLEDGSAVVLNSGSEVQVSFSADSRDLYLKQGEGLFRVRHDPGGRPFRIHIDKTIVQAVGTQFDVRRWRDQAVITVVEGAVQLKSRPSFMSALVGTSEVGPLTKITTGQSVAIDDGRAGEVKLVDVEAATAWRLSEERLEFTDQTLAEIAEEFNRHNASPKLRIEGDALRARRYVFLSFNDANPQSLINYLRKYETLDLVEEGDDIVIRERAR